MEVCGVREEDLKPWHEAMADFFYEYGDRGRVVRERPYHLQMAGNKKVLVEFLSDPEWALTFVGERLLDDFFRCVVCVCVYKYIYIYIYIYI